VEKYSDGYRFRNKANPNLYIDVANNKKSTVGNRINMWTKVNGSQQTLSMGIASAPDDGELPGELIRKADAAMVRAKLNGHNRVCLAREEKMVVKTAHYPQDMLHRLTKLSKREGASEAILLREALEHLLRRYDA
jgi:hypothetical protein